MKVRDVRVECVTNRNRKKLQHIQRNQFIAALQYNSLSQCICSVIESSVRVLKIELAQICSFGTLAACAAVIVYKCQWAAMLVYKAHA